MHTLVHAVSPVPPPNFIDPPAASLDLGPSEPRYPPRERHPPVRLGFTNTCFSFTYCSFLSRIHAYIEPWSHKEAYNDPNWVNAMNDELTTLAQTQTWDLVPLPNCKNIIGCKWVFKVNTHSDGSL